MPKVSPQYLDARRQEILDAALACFARDGFHDTTIQDISRQAGLSHGAIYRYFASKEEMIEAAARRDRDARARRFEEAERGRTPLEAIVCLLSSYVESDPSDDGPDSRPLRVIVFGEGVRNPMVNARIRATWHEVLDRISDLVRRGQETGAINPDLDPRGVARVAAALRDGLLIHQAIDPSIDAQACVQVLRALLHGRFAAPDHAEGVMDGERMLRPAPR
jgi:AcrR family transcriptional regulator